MQMVAGWICLSRLLCLDRSGTWSAAHGRGRSICQPTPPHCDLSHQPCRKQNGTSMKRAAYCAIALLLVLPSLIFSPAQAQVWVTMHHNAVGRTGQNLNETILNTSNVNVNQFGKLFACQVDGYVYAQPLYVAQVTISSAIHNVVYVATENDSVYAFDADNGAQLWHVNLGTPVPSTDISSTYKDLTPVIGITGTPVIDPVSSTIYLVAKPKNTSNNTYHPNLHAPDITHGAE